MPVDRLLPIGFLLGSGVSLPIAPGTRELTDEVLLHADRYYMHTDEEWYSRPSDMASIQPGAREQRVIQLIANLAARVESYYAARIDARGCRDRWCNYEDVGYHADSIASTLDRNRDDPGLMPLALEVCSDLRCSREELLQTAHDTVAFVRDVAFRKLISVTPTRNHLRLVIEAAQDPDVRRLPIYTLNHDCLLEDAFASEGVSLFDFRRTDGSGRILLDLEAQPQKHTRAILYKPHGSVRWRRFRPIDPQPDVDPWFSEWTGWHQDEHGARHDDGNRWRSIGGPLILVGRFNKELEYLDDPYWPTFCRLRQSLNSRQLLVVSGYGFGDRAINTLIINWIYARPPGERRLVVLHNDENVLLAGARGSIANKWHQWCAQGTLRWVAKFPCDYSWAELKQVLRQSS
jgi:hypothetical protein